MNEKMYMSEEKNVSIKSISSNSLIAGYIWEFQIYGDRIFTIDVIACTSQTLEWSIQICILQLMLLCYFKTIINGKGIVDRKAMKMNFYCLKQCLKVCRNKRGILIKLCNENFVILQPCICIKPMK